MNREDRFSLLDLRLTKVMRVAGARVKGMVDIYNVFNDNTILDVNATFGPVWLRPTSIVGGRLFKFGAGDRIDFKKLLRALKTLPRFVRLSRRRQQQQEGDLQRSPPRSRRKVTSAWL